MQWMLWTWVGRAVEGLVGVGVGWRGVLQEGCVVALMSGCGSGLGLGLQCISCHHCQQQQRCAAVAVAVAVVVAWCVAVQTHLHRHLQKCTMLLMVWTGLV